MTTYLIEEFTEAGREAFMSSRMTQEAVIRSLEIIGEASRNLSDELKATYPKIPWRQITAFRNFVVHVYWDIKLERVWEIVEKDLPSLKSQLAAVHDDLSDNNDERDNDET